MVELAVEGGAFVGLELDHRAMAFVPGLRRRGRSGGLLEVGDGGGVGARPCCRGLWPRWTALQMAMRWPSMERARMAEPAASTMIANGGFPAVLRISPMMWRLMSSAALRLRGAVPSTEMRKVFGLSCGRVWVARTQASTSLLSQISQRRKAPKAPRVRGWESPQHDGHAGLGVRRGRSGPMMWTMFSDWGLDVVKNSTPKSARLLTQGGDLARGDLVDDVEAVGDGRCGDRVVDRCHRCIVLSADLAVVERRPSKRLRAAGTFVDEMKVDVESEGSPLGSATRCWCCDFFEEGAGVLDVVIVRNRLTLFVL